MLKIRLIRFGRKHDPTFRLVVIDSRRAPQSGAYLESLGFYNPRKVGPSGKALKSDFQVKADRIKYWIRWRRWLWKRTPGATIRERLPRKIAWS